MALQIINRLSKLTITIPVERFDKCYPSSLNLNTTTTSTIIRGFFSSKKTDKTRNVDDVNVIFPKRVGDATKRYTANRSQYGRRRKRNDMPFQQNGDDIDVLAHSVTTFGSKHTAIEAEKKKTKDLQRLSSFVKFKTLENKYFRKPEKPNMLTWGCKEQIRFLHQQEAWPVEELAQKFPVSEMSIKKLLRSRVRLHRATDIKEHDLDVKSNWDKLYESLVSKLHSNHPTDDEDDEFIRDILVDIGSEENVCNVFPVQLEDEINLEQLPVKSRPKTLGVFSSIVKDEIEKKEIETNVLRGKHQEDLDQLRHTLTKIKELLEDSEVDNQDFVKSDNKLDSEESLSKIEKSYRGHISPIKISTSNSDDNTKIYHRVVDGCVYDENGDFLYRIS